MRAPSAAPGTAAPPDARPPCARAEPAGQSRALRRRGGMGPVDRMEDRNGDEPEDGVSGVG